MQIVLFLIQIFTLLKIVGVPRARCYIQHPQYVLDFFFKQQSIPMMSAGCEWVFSAAKLPITNKINRMKDGIIETCTLLRYWLKEAGSILWVY